MKSVPRAAIPGKMTSTSTSYTGDFRERIE